MKASGEKKHEKATVDSVRSQMRAAFEASGLTQEEIGVRMGFAPGGARQAVSRLLNAETYDPRLSTLVAFADAVGKPLKDLA
jgi:transcriptional regulator with XRE-family HTH domain